MLLAVSTGEEDDLTIAELAAGFSVDATGVFLIRKRSISFPLILVEILAGIRSCDHDSCLEIVTRVKLQD